MSSGRGEEEPDGVRAPPQLPPRLHPPSDCSVLCGEHLCRASPLCGPRGSASESTHRQFGRSSVCNQSGGARAGRQQPGRVLKTDSAESRWYAQGGGGGGDRCMQLTVNMQTVLTARAPSPSCLCFAHGHSNSQPTEPDFNFSSPRFCMIVQGSTISKECKKAVFT